jgi:DNA-binding NarL/FixJ family response regulator
MKNRKILILEDELIVGLDLQEILINEGFKTNLVNSFDEGMLELTTFQPQLVLCDINLNGKNNGIDFAKEVNKLYPFTEIIFITSYTSVKYTEEAEETRPLDYIVKPWNEEQIKVALRRAFKYIDSKKDNMNLMGELSPSEYRILSLIAEQKTSKEIGQELFISEKTVRNHRYNISKKLNLDNNNNNLLKWAIANFSKA